MNKKILVTITLFCTTSIANAESPDAFDTTKGPYPSQGVQVLPLSKINLPPQLKTRQTFALLQQKQKGYRENDSTYPRSLISLQYTAKDEIEKNKNSDQYDTHLKKNIADIKLAFPYSAPSAISPDNTLGFAALGLWQNGWTGIAQLFKENSIGVCSYKIENILVSKGAIQIDENTVRHDVNNKITTIDIAGSMNSGFIYTISWYDKTYFHDLECANLAFKPELKDKLIALAKKIDAGAF